MKGRLLAVSSSVGVQTETRQFHFSDSVKYNYYYVLSIFPQP